MTAAKWHRKSWMNPLETYMAAAEGHRGFVYAGAATLVLLIIPRLEGAGRLYRISLYRADSPGIGDPARLADRGGGGDVRNPV